MPTIRSRKIPLPAPRVFPRTSAIVAAAVGLLVLLGWLFNVAVFKSLLPGLVAMNPTTALCFIAAGASLWLLELRKAHTGVHLWGTVLAGAVALIGLIKLVDIAFGLDLHVDQLLFHDSLAATTGQVANRMAPNTATAFLLLGLGLVCQHLERWVDLRVAQALALAGTVIASLAVIGYVYGVSSLTGVSSYIHMALNTAITLVVLSLGVLGARSRMGVMAVFTSDGPGGALARAQLPIAIITPIIFGWLRIKGQEMKLYNMEAGVSLTAVYSVYLSAVLIWVGARALDRVDAVRRREEMELERTRRETEALRHVVEDLTPDAVTEETLTQRKRV